MQRKTTSSGKTFQFTPLREGRPDPDYTDAAKALISIHAPARGAPYRASCASCAANFNSRPCERGDAITMHCSTRFIGFQFTPLREGRPGLRVSDVLELKFQFTPLREGRRGAIGTLGRAWPISIHAPARGATLELASNIPAFLFQFTPLREGRLCGSGCFAHLFGISIHAPARGATRTGHRPPRRSAYFNSRPCERGDGYISGRDWHAYDFNSRPCERGDEMVIWMCRNSIYFNSRPCERGDRRLTAWGGCLKRFQFTPLREGRQQNQTKYALFFSAIIEKNS